MSFGLGVGDIITVTNLAWSTVQHVRQACGEYDELTREASSIHTVLHKLQQEVADPDSIINRSNDDHTRELSQLVGGCEEVLKNVDLIILKYTALGGDKYGKGKRAWQKIKFGNDEMQELTELRQKLSHHTASITLFLNLLSVGSQGRIEKQMMRQGGDLNELRLTLNSMVARMMSQDQSVEGTVLTMFSGDDQSVWKSFRRELIRDGYDSSVISQHMDTIKAYIKELADRGVVDELCGSNQEQILQPTIDEYTQKQLFRGSKISMHEPQTSVIRGYACPEFVPEFDRISRMHNLIDTGPYSEQSDALSNTIAAEPLMTTSVEFRDSVQELPHLALNEEYSRVTTPVPQTTLPKLNDRNISCSTISINNSAEHNNISLRLEKLWPETGSIDFKSTFNIITIAEGRENPFSTSSWHRLYTNLSANVTKCQILRYKYQISDSAGPVWASLVFQGQLLLETIFGHKDGLSLPPLIFLCYGLGGLVLKRALTLAYEKPLDPASQFLLAMNSGIVFLGTPHPLYIDCSQWARLNLILKSNASISQSFLAEAERDVARMANVSSDFDKLRLDVPIISVYEKKESRIRVNYWRSIKVVLVGPSLASTSQRPQTLLGINSDHAQLCKVTSEDISFCSELQALVTSAIRRSLDIAPDNNQMVLALSQPPLSPANPSKHVKGLSESYATPFSNQLDCGSMYSGSVKIPLGKRKSKYLSAAGVVGQGIEVDIEPPVIASFIKRKAFAKLPCYMLPPESANPDFWGRKDILTQLDDILLPIKQETHVSMATRSPCVVLGGMGGIGKTQIAMHYALTRKTQFDAIFWVQADNDAKLAQGFVDIAVSLGLVSGSESVDPALCRSIALEWLSLPIKSLPPTNGHSTLTTTGASYLLVFDNADDPQITSQYWPTSRTGAILITSRCPWMSQKHYQSIHIQVEPLSPMDGGAMLRKLVSCDWNSENAKSSVTLATTFGGHPVAIVQLAGIINSKNLTLEQSLNIYEKKNSSAFGRWSSQPARTEDDYIYSTLTVWDGSLGELSAESTSLLQTISFLEPCCIPEYILLPELNITIELAFPRTAEAYSKAREELYSSSLIQWFEESDEISIHCLVQEVVIHRMSDDHKLVAFGQALYLVRQAWPHGKDWLLGDPPQQALLERLVPHVQKLKVEYEKLNATRLKLETKIAMAELLQTSGWYMVQKRAYSIAHLLFWHASAICKEHRHALLHVHADLSFCYAFMGALTNQKPSAILAYASRHLHLRRELDDSSEAATQQLGLAHCELGYAYLLTGEFSKAIEHCRMAKAIVSKARTTDMDDTWSYRADVYEAWSLAATGRLDESELLLLGTLQTTNEVLDTRRRDNFRLGTISKCLGFVRAKQGLMEESLNAHEQAMVNFVASVGHNTYETSVICVKLGEHHMLVSQFETASIYFEQALRGFANHGWSSKDIARTTYKLSMLRDAQGDHIGSQVQLLRAEELYHQLVPSSDSNQQLSEAHFDSLVLMTSR